MTSELNKMKAEQEKLLTETVYVQRLTKTGDTTGGWSESWATVAITTGRIGIPKNPSTVEAGGQARMDQKFVLTLPSDTELEKTDRLQINGVQYEILSILTRTEQTALRVEVVEV